ncbi:TonB-dependent receptor [Rhodobacteraceae bacterium D3-12]|nr:TonB-dependent receptor [Rhodobacteraceae bacterium D3-12]
MTCRHPSFRHLSAVSVLAFGATLWSGPAFAQGSEPVYSLDEIVMVGTGLPTQVRDNPASVSVLGEAEINCVPPSSVATILSEVPGVKVTESGDQRITIRGEDSRRVAIMIDGQQLTDHTGYGTPILIDPFSIERIEVVRGPSSVVSGNRAIGGVVNIITKRGADKPIEVTTSTGYFSATDGWRASLGIAGQIGDFDYRLSYSKTEQGNVKTPDGTLDRSARSDQGMLVHLGYRKENHYFGFRAQDFDMSAEVYTGDPNFFIDLPKRDLTKYGLFYEGTDLTPWLTSLKADAYTQTVNRQFNNLISIPMGPGAVMSIQSDSVDEQITSGFHVTAELQFSPGHRTVVGLEYEDDRQKANKYSLTVSPFGPPSGPTVRVTDASIRTMSVFAQHEIKFSDKLIGTFGARYYKVDSVLNNSTVNGVANALSSNSDSRLLGSAGLVYKLKDDLTLRGNISQGYNYPTLGELFLETTAGGAGVILGNPNLRPETSTTFELGARYERGVILDATLFYTDAENYIASLPTGTSGVLQYQNVATARTWGAELTAEFAPMTAMELRPYVNAAYTQRSFTYANGYSTRDTGTPEWAATIGLRKDWTRGQYDGTLDLFIKGETKAVYRDDSGAIPTDGLANAYATLNLRGSVNLSKKAAVSFEVGNILNKSYRPYGQYAGAGRNVSVFLTTRF